jgi:phosphoglucomutase
MAALMNDLRKAPPSAFGDEPVAWVADYQNDTITENGAVRPLGMPKSNVLYYQLKNGDVIIARPSGTEPKIKFYYLLQAVNREDGENKLAAYRKTLDARIQ